MTQRNRTWNLEANSEYIRESLFDLQIFGSLHPLILEARKLDPVDGNDHYLVIERPNPALPFRIRYKAVVSPEGPSYSISIIGLFDAKFVYDIERTGDATATVSLDLSITGGVSVLRSVLAKKMLAAQDEIMKALEVR